MRSAVTLLALTLAAVPSCRRCGVDHAQTAPEAVTPLPAAHATPGGPYRLLLDGDTRARLRAAAEAKTPAWRVLSSLCEEATAEHLDSGYQGFQWADALASTALCWHATRDPRYGRAAVAYLNALLDDRFAVGDERGGETVVRHDSGYGIRTFGVYSALGYDWLRDAPGMTPALRARTRARLGQWLGWYARDGYLRDHVLSNYYWGYLTALALSGLSASGESPEGDRWLEGARTKLEHDVLPAFRERLPDGGWPEGFQYGEYTGLEIGLVVRAFQTAAGIDLRTALPWLGTLARHHSHALLPDGRSVYDGGTWGEHPARPSPLALSGALLASGTDAEARYMVRHLLPPLTREHAWVRLLVEDPRASERDPRVGAASSLHLRGLGLTFARSRFSSDAVWTSFQAGPFLAMDHQDKDQGHFELWRGSDGLVVDGGDAEGSATINHNTLLIDDHEDHMNYTPNQGVWGSGVRTTRFFDDGTLVVAVGDLADAYAPKCAAEGCPRSVEGLTRTFVYVRPGLLVLDDRALLASAGYGVTWIAHVTTRPTLGRAAASASVGGSRVDMAFLEPPNAMLSAPKEPTASGEGPHRQNHPWGPMWRIEAKSPIGSRERGFTVFLSAGARSAPKTNVTRVSSAGLRGGVAAGTAVLFASAEGKGHAALGVPARSVVVLDLEPGRRYRLEPEVDPTSCFVSVRLTPDPAGRVASPAGSLRATIPACRR